MNRVITENRTSETKLHILCTRAKLLQSCSTPCDPMDCSLLGSQCMGFSRQKYWSGGRHALLQGIFLTQGSNLGLWHLLPWQAGSLPLGAIWKPHTHSLCHINSAFSYTDYRESLAQVYKETCYKDFHWFTVVIRSFHIAQIAHH